jgi:hypothetical protein
VYDNLQELDNLLVDDSSDLLAGGGAQAANFIASTLQSTSLEMMGLGVVNTEGDERMLAKVQPVIDGLKAGATLDTKKRAVIREYQRWVDRKMKIQERATGLDMKEFIGNSRSAKEILSGLDPSEPSEEQKAKLKAEGFEVVETDVPEGGGLLDTPYGNVGDAVGDVAAGVGSLLNKAQELSPGR